MSVQKKNVTSFVEIEESATAWVVFNTTDRTEGRAPNYPEYVCMSKTTANRLASGRYIQGSDCPVREVSIFKNNGWWFAPTKLEYPSKGDLKLDQEREKTASEIKKIKEKLNGISLTKEEIQLLLKMGEL